MATLGKHLVLVGGGHAHLTTLARSDELIRQGHRVTLIGPSDYHYYSGMGPGLLSGIYRPQDVRFHIRKMAQDRGTAFVAGRVTAIEPDRQALVLHSGEKISYDVVSFNTGSYVPDEGVPGPDKNVFTVKPIENLLRARDAIIQKLPEKPLQLLVVGGGAAGLELAGNLRRLVRDNGGTAQIILAAGRRFLAAFPPKIRNLAKKYLLRLDVDVEEGCQVERIGTQRAVFTDGRELPYDFALLAWGILPSPIFRSSALPTDASGALLVNPFLQSIRYPQIFGGGDCIGFEKMHLDKVGVYAVRQNPVLFQNLSAALNQQEMQPFNPGGAYLLIVNLGDGGGILWKRQFVWSGKLAFIIKNFIDQKFMKTFQLSGERES